MNLLNVTKYSLVLVFLGLPLILISIVFFLGIGLGNAGLLFLSVGQIALVPIAVMILHFFTNIIPDKVYHSDIGQLVPLVPLGSMSEKMNVYPSFWMAHFTFFCSYIFFNALELYNLAPISDDAKYSTKIQIRKTRMGMIMGFLMFTFLALILIRYRATRTETFFGILFSIASFGALGYGWYMASSAVGIRTMDIFGVAQQMFLVPNKTDPSVCVKTV